jgi:hypothetical protein
MCYSLLPGLFSFYFQQVRIVCGILYGILWMEVNIKRLYSCGCVMLWMENGNGDGHCCVMICSMDEPCGLYLLHVP